MRFKLNYKKVLRLVTTAAVLCGCFLVTLVKSVAAEPTGNYTTWQTYRDNLIKDSSLVRYYAFQEGKGEQVRNSAQARVKIYLAEKRVDYQERTALKYWDFNVQFPGPSAEEISWVEGRWPGKKAVRLGQYTLQGGREFSGIKNKSFTMECWVRKNGPGSIKGSNNAVNGTILAASTGYSYGWRLTTDDSSPNGPIDFWLGKPGGGESGGGDPLVVQVNSVSDGIWHYVAATWNGEAVSIYLDGLLKDAKKYSGDYFYGRDHLFRVGYNAYGYGSVNLDIDEVAIYERALSAEEIKNHYSLLP